MKVEMIFMSLIFFGISSGSMIDSVPPGLIIAFASDNIPSDYLECNGQSVSTTDYPDLFSAI